MSASKNTTTKTLLDCLKPGAGNKHMLIGYDDEHSDRGISEYHSWKVDTDSNIIREDIIGTLSGEMYAYINLETKGSTGSADQYECYRFGMEIFGTSEEDVEKKIVSELEKLNLSELIDCMDSDDSCFPIVFIPAGDMNKLITVAGLINY